MINTLKKKFIVITMASLIIVFITILTIINVVNYFNVTTTTDNIIDFLAYNNGTFGTDDRPDVPPGTEDPDVGGEEGPPAMPNDSDYQKSEKFNLNEETPFTTRFFTATIADDGTYTIDLSHIAAITEEKATSMTSEALSRHFTSGYIGKYRFKVVNDGKMVIFVDNTMQLDNFTQFLWVSIGVAFGATIAIFVLIFFIASRVVRPIAESYDKQKQFITDASHELKTPLTIISANNEINEMEFGETESSKAITKQVGRLTAMVKNLTALARLDENRELEKVDLDLSSIADEAIELFTPAIESKGRTLNYEIEPNIKMQGDDKLIKQLFSIILENASKYAKSYVFVQLSKQGQKIVLLARNDADGIKEGNMDECFERFYRANESRASSVEGSGIGLSIAKEVVLRHKGTITAYGDKEGCFNIKVSL